MKDIRLAIDVESGDFGPDVIISGIIEAEKRSKKPFHSLLCGNKDRIEGYLKKNNTDRGRSEEHTSELQSRPHLVCRLLLEKKKKKETETHTTSIMIRYLFLG